MTAVETTMAWSLIVAIVVAVVICLFKVGVLVTLAGLAAVAAVIALAYLLDTMRVRATRRRTVGEDADRSRPADLS